MAGEEFFSEQKPDSGAVEGAPATGGAPVADRTGMPDVRCLAAAFVSALLVLVVTGNGLVYQAYFGTVQIGLLIGVAAGLLAGPPSYAAASAVVGALAGWFAQPTTFLTRETATIVMIVAVSAAVAAGVAFVVRGGMMRRGAVLAVAMVLLVGAMWSTTAAAIVTGNDKAETLIWFLEQVPKAGTKMVDTQFYRLVVWKMRAGEDYYEAFRTAYHDNARWASDPPGVLAVRPPWLFWLWKVVPGWPRSSIWLFLAISTVAVLLVPSLSRRSAPPGLTIAAAGAVATYALFFASTPELYLSEQWCGMLVVPVVAALGFAQTSGRRRAWVAVAAGIALVAFLIRELMVFVLLAGLVSAWFAPREHRRAEFLTWGSALAAGLAAWAVHAVFAARIVTATRMGTSTFVGKGGLDNVAAGVTGGAKFLGPWAWVPWALFALGIVGCLALPDLQQRVFAAVVVLGPWTGFLFVGNGSFNLATGRPVNYWAGIVMPVTLALAGAGLAAILRLRSESCAEPMAGMPVMEEGGS